jgi:uncharacterized membrane protein YgcG
MDLIKKYYSEGKIFNLNKYLFIFEENNYTQLATYDKKMMDLYEKQSQIFLLCGMRTYIIAINNTTENNRTFRNNMRDNLKNWGVYVNNSVFTVVFTDTNEGTLYTGNIAKSLYIPDKDALKIKLSFLNYTGNQEYYAAYENLIDNILGACKSNTKTSGNNSDNSNPQIIRYPQPSPSHTGEILGGIFGGVAALCAVIGAIICCWKCKCLKNNKSDNNDADYDYNYKDRSHCYDNHSTGGGNVSISVGGNSNNGPSVGGNNSVGGGPSIDANSGGA